MGTDYTAQVTSRGGRDGFVRSSDGQLDLKVGTPKEGEKEGTNPEQLFAAAYSTCFHSALKSVAASKKISTENSEVTAKVTLHKDGDSYHLSVQMEVTVPGLDQDQTLKLAEAAHQVCPYSKATRNNIEVELQARTAVTNK
ncbi:organic hydroperoxide resistance protein [Paenibacillus eucommiae]|uniref:Ohr subfamily peroxiredoxin n=1 Tax=Paenibacillus eucommiae TaxID=1355755 RepID=A0ABS4IV46_9BACL|nr:organic hydroperoxide resistance protein [Paenibacillus eucommiae]MBP1991455.1 Ohr subfamily peroxiredoxin [Paenibacillus eucommiae]